jgi:hypothetical protein
MASSWAPSPRLLGALLSTFLVWQVTSMFFLDPTFAAITLMIVIAIFVYITLAFDAAAWPDIRQALGFCLARAALSGSTARADPKYVTRSNLCCAVSHRCIMVCVVTGTGGPTCWP